MINPLYKQDNKESKESKDINKSSLDLNSLVPWVNDKKLNSLANHYSARLCGFDIESWSFYLPNKVSLHLFMNELETLEYRVLRSSRDWYIDEMWPPQTEYIAVVYRKKV